MIFCHIVDDFYSQPTILSNLKQKSWWKENAPDKKYENDYLMALVIHAFSWTFMIHLPLIVFLWFTNLLDNVEVFGVIIVFVINWVIHAWIDDLKANKLKINLIQDQIMHFVQIFLTWFLYCGL